MIWSEVCREALVEKGKLLDLSFSEEEISQMVRYGELLVEWNEKMNLTGITDPAGVAVKHMLDSAVGVKRLPAHCRLVDVGTGAGFPGVVLKILRPDIEVVLLDSLKKRLTFLDAVIEELKLEKITTVHSRAEDGGHRKELRESFDVAVARAVAGLPALLEHCLPFVKVGGVFWAWKGPKGQGELEESKRALGLLYGKILEVVEIDFPETDEPRLLIGIKKVKEMDNKYPRKPGSGPL